MLDAFKGLTGGGKVQKQSDDLLSLIAAAREERGALSAMLTQISMRTSKLEQMGKSLEQVGQKAAAASDRLDELVKRVDGLEESARSFGEIDTRIQALLDAAVQVQQAAEKLTAPDGELQKHRQSMQQLSSQALETQASIDALKKERAGLDDLRAQLRKSQGEIKESVDGAATLRAELDQARGGRRSRRREAGAARVHGAGGADHAAYAAARARARGAYRAEHHAAPRPWRGAGDEPENRECLGGRARQALERRLEQGASRGVREVLQGAGRRKPHRLARFLRLRRAGELDQEVVNAKLASPGFEGHGRPEGRDHATGDAGLLFRFAHGRLGGRFAVLDVTLRENPVGGALSSSNEQHAKAVLAPTIDNRPGLLDELRHATVYSLVRKTRVVKIVSRCPGRIALPRMLFQALSEATVVLNSFAMRKSVSPRLTR